MSDFFAELEEDIREERIYTLWKKYGNYIIGGALAIVLGTAGHTIWKYVQHQSQIKSQISFAKSLDLLKHGQKDQALKAFQELAKQGGGYGKLAQLYEASLLQNPDELYAKISKENKTDPALNNLAKFLTAQRSFNTSPDVTPLQSFAAPNNAWGPLSLELLALVDLRAGDESKAAERYIQALKEPHLSQSEQVRIALMLSQLNVPPSVFEALEAGEEM